MLPLKTNFWYNLSWFMSYIINPQNRPYRFIDMFSFLVSALHVKIALESRSFAFLISDYYVIIIIWFTIIIIQPIILLLQWRTNWSFKGNKTIWRVLSDLRNLFVKG